MLFEQFEMCVERWQDLDDEFSVAGNYEMMIVINLIRQKIVRFNPIEDFIHLSYVWIRNYMRNYISLAYTRIS